MMQSSEEEQVDNEVDDDPSKSYIISVGDQIIQIFGTNFWIQRENATEIDVFNQAAGWFGALSQITRWFIRTHVRGF